MDTLHVVDRIVRIGQINAIEPTDTNRDTLQERLKLAFYCQRAGYTVGCFQMLPAELIDMIADFLSPRYCAMFAATCRSLRDICATRAVRGKAKFESQERWRVKGAHKFNDIRTVEDLPRCFKLEPELPAIDSDADQHGWHWSARIIRAQSSQN
jgi:hypothetical protein